MTSASTLKLERSNLIIELNIIAITNKENVSHYNRSFLLAKQAQSKSANNIK